MTKRERERRAWNLAAGIFANRWSHVPMLTDRDPHMPKESAKFRREVIDAIQDGILRAEEIRESSESRAAE